MTSRKSAARRIGIAMGSALAVFGLASTAALAGEGNSNYLGILSSTTPTGYTPSPLFYSIASGPSQLDFEFDVTNLTAEPQSMTLQLDLDHITKYQGLDVSDGQPGVVNGAVVDGQFDGTAQVQVQDPNPTFTTLSIAPQTTQTMHVSRQLAAGQCGYFQVDLAKAGLTAQKGLVGFEIRVLGCKSEVPSPSPSGSPGPATSPSPSGSPGPATSPSPEGSPGPAASPSPGGSPGPATSPSPTGGVLAETGSTPPLVPVAVTLVILGAIALVAGFAWRRKDS